MKNVREFIWPVIGLLAVVVSGWLLYRELRGMSLDDVWDSLTAVPAHRYALAALSTLVAYAALAWYDRIALLHLGVRHISWLFVSITSFTTYALSHNIGASVFSGAVVRYRAYTSKGLGGPQIAVLVAQGMTNREAAAALFLSPKTIEYHLGQIYRKLDVRGRAQLARLMAMEMPEGARDLSALAEALS